MQGYAGMTQRATSSTGSTVWGAHPLPQNREVTMTASGDGSLSLWRYQYPDQRKIKVGRGTGHRALGGCQQWCRRVRRPAWQCCGGCVMG